MNTEIKSILSSSEINGNVFWSRPDGDIHSPSGFSTIDVLSTLGFLGCKYKTDKIIQKAIEFVLTYKTDDFLFRYNPKSSKLPCITAKIIAAFQRLGFTNDYIESCINNFFVLQQPDGGWRCNTVKLGKSLETDSSNPGTTLYILDTFRKRSFSNKQNQQIQNAIEFLLMHWVTRKPLGPCEFGIGTNFMKVEFPILRYNILYYCYVLSFFSGVSNDKRFKDILSILKNKLIDNQIINDNPHKNWKHYSFGQKCQPCIPATTIFNDICANLL